jgi:hypothetical protein
MVLDPWNGAGTTTQVANDLGFATVGFDINPSMVVVANARLLNNRSVLELRARLNEVTGRAKRDRARVHSESDPLTMWLQPRSARLVRRVEDAIRRTFDASGVSPHLNLQSLGSEIAFCFLALFRSLRQFLSPFRASNPAWLKVARSQSDLVSIECEQLLGAFEKTSNTLLDCYDVDNHSWDEQVLRVAHVGVAASTRLPLASKSADIVISSPPYCTRIDYAVATSIELAILRYGPAGGLRELRDRMIGTSTIRCVTPREEPGWGPTCRNLLANIAAHHSKASQGYYYKTHMQYFADIYASLRELDRCIRPAGHCVLVAQDSYYKDIHNDLPLILREMGNSLGWNLHCHRDFTASRHMGRRNARSRPYRVVGSATEYVLWFRTSERRE